jgi:hypothetical protein
LEWIPPSDPSGGYSFSIAEARLIFRDVDDLKIVMDWAGTVLDVQIDRLRVVKSRTTPTGLTQHYYEFDFSEPQAELGLWSTGYAVVLLNEPERSTATNLPRKS